MSSTLSVPEFDNAFKSNVGGMNMFSSIQSMQFPSSQYSKAENGNNVLIAQDQEDTIAGPTTMQLTCANLADESQMFIEKGDAVFLFNPRKEVPEEAVLMNMQVLNYYLEEAYIVRSSINNGLASEDMPQSSKRKTRGIDFMSFPVTLSEFENQISFLGFMYSSNTPRGVRMREVLLAVDGLFKEMPNWFGPTDIGTHVELRVMYYKNTYSRRIKYDGTDIGDSVPGKYLQVRPYINRETIHPIINQKSDINKTEPEEDDAYYLEPTVLRQIVLGSTKRSQSGLREISNNVHHVKSRYSVIVDIPTEALVYSLGQVVKQKKVPSEYDSRMAIRSSVHLTKLTREGCSLWLSMDLQRFMLTTALNDN